MRCHEDYNLYSNGSEIKYIYTETEKANVAKMLTIRGLCGVGVSMYYSFDLSAGLTFFKMLVRRK